MTDTVKLHGRPTTECGNRPKAARLLLGFLLLLSGLAHLVTLIDFDNTLFLAYLDHDLAHLILAVGLAMMFVVFFVIFWRMPFDLLPRKFFWSFALYFMVNMAHAAFLFVVGLASVA